MGAGAPYFLVLLAPFPIGVAFESAASTASEAVDGFARDRAIGGIQARADWGAKYAAGPGDGKYPFARPRARNYQSDQRNFSETV